MINSQNQDQECQTESFMLDKLNEELKTKNNYATEIDRNNGDSNRKRKRLMKMNKKASEGMKKYKQLIRSEVLYELNESQTTEN